MNEKKINQIYTKIRSTTIGQEIIKVVYMGDLNGFHYGKVIEAEARYVKSSGQPHPYPKYRHCSYRINDEDGDSFTVSDNGITFYKGFYPVPDNFELEDEEK